MNTTLTLDDIDDKYKEKLYTQNYTPKPIIEGVKLYPLHLSIGEDGDFSELIRINEKAEIEGIPDFKLAQLNRSRLNGGIIKAWHLHLQQDELWYVNPEVQLLIGLLDLRKKSPTQGLSMRFVMGAQKSQMLFIPKGVAHGSANLSDDSCIIWYFVDKKFNPEHPDEKRLPWDTLGANFWEPKRD